MDKIDIRDQILRTLKANKSEVDNFNDAVFEDDFLKVSESIVKNLPIYVVMQQSELLIAFQKYLLLPGVDNMRTDKHRSKAFIRKSNL